MKKGPPQPTPDPKVSTQTPPQEHVTTSTYRRTAPSPSPAVFFSGLPELRGAFAPSSPISLTRSTTPLSPFCSPWAPQRWPAAPKASEPRRSTGAGAKEARALGSYGMHLHLWVGEPKVTTELVDVDYRWVFWDDCARMDSSSDKVTTIGDTKRSALNKWSLKGWCVFGLVS